MALTLGHQQLCKAQRARQPNVVACSHPHGLPVARSSSLASEVCRLLLMKPSPAQQFQASFRHRTSVVRNLEPFMSVKASARKTSGSFDCYWEIKRAVFTGLKECIWMKLHGWEEILLSKPGKEVLIKSIIQAIPTYMMSIFRLPDGLIDDIHLMMARFWWGSTDLSRKLNWQRVGNGSDIKVWESAWLLGCSSVLVLTPLPNSDMSFRLCDLIDVDSMSWKVEAVQEYFWASHQAFILSIPLSIRCTRDVLYWWPLKTGEYNVKSEYWLGKRNPNTGLSHQGSDVWKIISSLKGPLKLCHFLWRAFQIWSVSDFAALVSQAPYSDFSPRFLWLASKVSSKELLTMASLIWVASGAVTR
uniref:Reverse transcriptase zinc-binding domain-containing protein n=1 Tax=Chenopodium quinoa TaxID=63459 RepID=A0A803MZK0_CHEQI